MGSGEIFNKYGHMKEGGGGYDKFDYEELAEQLIEDEDYDDNGLIVITQEF